MTPRLNRVILIATALLYTTACGTRDYAMDKPKENRVAEPPVFENTRATTKQLLLPPEAGPSEGYLWSALKKLKAPPETAKKLRCLMMDTPNTNPFQSFGTALFGGAILGVIIRQSGSELLGQPVNPGTGHWFWKRLDVTFKNTSQGVLRGGILGGACQTLLAGGNLTPIAGILGGEFEAVSAALSLGSMALVASSLVVDKTRFGGPIDPPTLARPGVYNFGKNVVRRLGPGFSIMLASGGVFWFTYLYLQDENRDLAKDPACDFIRSTPPETLEPL